MDDVLSAVDPHVANWLIRNVLTGPGLQSKTRIVVTKNEACIRLADQVVHMHQGQVQQAVKQSPQALHLGNSDETLGSASASSCDAKFIESFDSPAFPKAPVDSAHSRAYLRWVLLLPLMGHLPLVLLKTTIQCMCVSGHQNVYILSLL